MLIRTCTYIAITVEPVHVWLGATGLNVGSQECGEFTDSPFVRAEGRFFMVGCERFFPRGYNAWWYMKFPFNAAETMSYAQAIGLNTVGACAWDRRVAEGLSRGLTD